MHPSPASRTRLSSRSALVLLFLCVLFVPACAPTDEPGDFQEALSEIPPLPPPTSPPIGNQDVSENASVQSAEDGETDLPLLDLPDAPRADAENASGPANATEVPAAPELISGAVDLTARIGPFKARQVLREGQGISVENRTLVVVLVAERDGEPEALLSLDGETVALGEHGEEYFEDAWVYVHHVYYRDR